MASWALTALAIAACWPSEAQALGAGRVQTLSALGQPLNLLLPVQLSAGESLSADCVRAEVQVGETRVAPQMLSVQLEGESEERVRAIRLRTASPIDEPLVHVQLALGCPARLTRQLTAFIDPPGGAGQEPEAQAEVREFSPAVRAALATSQANPKALLDPAREAPVSAGTSVATSSGEGSPARRPATRPAARTEAAAPAVRRSAPKAAAPAPARESAKLSLEQPEVLQERAALIAAAASATALAEQSQQQLAAMGRQLARLQADQAAAQKAMQALRSELSANREVLARGGDNSLVVILLSGLCVALGLSSFMLWRKSRLQRGQSPWWDNGQRPTPAVADADADAPAKPARPAVRSAVRPVPAPVAPAAAVRAPADEQTMELPGLLGDATALPTMPSTMPPDAPPAPVPLPHEEPVGLQLVDTTPAALPAVLPPAVNAEVSVEELIDLEQQVDFFLVLGQDDAAIELLSDRLGQRAEASGLPYLQLLELHQRRGDREAFERTAARFSSRFGVAAPAWSADLNGSEGLAAHPDLVSMLQAVWSDSAASMALLQQLLAHKREGVKALDLPSYRDLLMLYAVARDRSEHEVRGEEVDLFLPLDTQPGQDLMATMVWQGPAPGAAAATPTVDLDLDLSLVEHEPVPPRQPLP